MSNKNKLEDLNITKDELDKISEALKKPEFRQMLAEYAEEISNPENRKKYEEEIAAMEREQGRDVQFIHPNGCWVVKTFDKKASTKVFINVASNEIIGKPSSRREKNGSSSGLNWNIPHSMAPPREDMDKENQRCTVVDVVFHPDTIRMAESNIRFRDMINSIAMEACCKSFQMDIDMEKKKMPKNMKYKGMPKAAVVKRQLGEPELTNFNENPKTVEEKEKKKNPIEEKMKSIVKEVKEKEKNQKVNDQARQNSNGKIEPKFNIVYSRQADMQDFVTDVSLHHDTQRPSHIKLSVELPGVKSAGEINLDVFERKVHMDNDDYELNLPLTYPVDEANSSAKFDKKRHMLIVTMAALPEKISQDPKPLIEELDQTENDADENDETVAQVDEIEMVQEEYPLQKFDSEENKTLPGHVQASETSKTIEVLIKNNDKNIDISTINSHRTKDGKSFKLQFQSRGQGGFPIFYQIVLKPNEKPKKYHFLSHSVVTKQATGGQIKVVLEKNNQKLWRSLRFGIDDNSLKASPLFYSFVLLFIYPTMFSHPNALASCNFAMPFLIIIILLLLFHPSSVINA